MGDVLVVYRVMPEDMEKFEEIKEGVKGAIPEGAELVEIKEQPVAFGLKALLVGVKMPDEEGIQEKVEQALSAVEGVESVSVDVATLL